MPFRSKQQMKACFASNGFNGKVDCKQWAKETPNKKNLPNKKKQKGGCIECMQSGGTLYDYLLQDKRFGEDYARYGDKRKKLAKQLGIDAYRGTADQNIRLLAMLENADANAPNYPMEISQPQGRSLTADYTQPIPTQIQPVRPVINPDDIFGIPPISQPRAGSKTVEMQDGGTSLPFLRGRANMENVLQLGVTGLSWLGNNMERNRQNQYMYNQFSALGQMDPMPVDDFQPNPFSMYAKYGGSLRKYQRAGKVPTVNKDDYNTAKAEYYKLLQNEGRNLPLDMNDRRNMRDGHSIMLDNMKFYEPGKYWTTEPLKDAAYQVGNTLRSWFNQLMNTHYKKGGWIQKAVNPEHKGYCTPMTKKTCTPRRKALARRFKKMAKD